MAVLLDTAALDTEHRGEAFRSTLIAATAPHDVRLHGSPEAMHARLEYWRLSNDVVVLCQESSGITHVRDDRYTRHDGPERVVFVLHDGGSGQYVHEDHAEVLGRGAMYVTDLTARYRYSRPGEGTARILQVERASLGLSAEQVVQASARLPASPLYNLLRNHVAGLCTAAPAISQTAEAPDVAGATVRLASSMLRTALSADQATHREVEHDYLIQRILLFIKLHYALPGLDAQTIADAHHISVRYLFKLWADQPCTVTDTIMQSRLDAARALLEARPQLPIAVVGTQCGFINASHFTRRFRAAFGIPPTGFRAQRDLRRAD